MTSKSSRWPPSPHRSLVQPTAQTSKSFEPDDFVAGVCVNCDLPLSLDQLLYCSELCRQIAKVVRYRRATWADGRDSDPLVEDAIKTRIALILGGGYDERRRRLSIALRLEVLTANDGRCALCCASPAVQVDHIEGSSSDRANLQGVCDDCHRVKTNKNMVPLGPADLAKHEIVDQIMKRARAHPPLRLCDDDQRWRQVWPVIARRNRTRWADEPMHDPALQARVDAYFRDSV